MFFYGMTIYKDSYIICNMHIDYCWSKFMLLLLLDIFPSLSACLCFTFHMCSLLNGSNRSSPTMYICG